MFLGIELSIGRKGTGILRIEQASAACSQAKLDSVELGFNGLRLCR